MVTKPTTATQIILPEGSGMQEALQVAKLTKDMKKAAKLLTLSEARYLVDAYYQVQGYRLAAANQARSQAKTEEPAEFVAYVSSQMQFLEGEIAKALDQFSGNNELGRWARSITGIGPVIAAGLLAHIDITKAPCAAAVWSYAGLNPDMVWEKGKKRPFNADLKTLCWKIGESYVKVQNNEKDLYGKLYAKRKKRDQERNERGEFAEQAAEVLRKFKIGKSTEAYKHYSSGKLPPAHVHARARRYAVKLFLSHYFTVAYFVQYKRMPKMPYAFSEFITEPIGHVHLIAPPNMEIIAGMQQEYNETWAVAATAFPTKPDFKRKTRQKPEDFESEPDYDEME